MNFDYLQQNHIISESRKRSHTFHSQKNLSNYFSKNSDSISGRTNLTKNTENDNIGNDNKFEYSKLRNSLPNLQQKKKRVKFNENIEIIKVKSYKKYNKEEYKYSFVNNYNSKNKRRQDIKCTCNII